MMTIDVMQFWLCFYLFCFVIFWGTIVTWWDISYIISRLFWTQWSFCMLLLMCCSMFSEYIYIYALWFSVFYEVYYLITCLQLSCHDNWCYEILFVLLFNLFCNFRCYEMVFIQLGIRSCPIYVSNVLQFLYLRDTNHKNIPKNYYRW